MKRLCINTVLLSVVIFLFFSCRGNSDEPLNKQTHVSTCSESEVIRLEGGDWGYPTPFAHYPRGPGGFKMCMMFDSLLERDENGLIPWLATDWEVVSAGRIYRFKIRENVKWHDGMPLTVQDVKFSLEYANRHAAVWSYIFNKIEKVVIEDNMRLNVTVRETEVPMLDYIGRTRIIPKHIWEKVDQPRQFQTPLALIGTGPYQLTDYNKSHGTYRFESANDFWGPKPAVNTLYFVPVSQPILAFEQGEIDLAVVPPDILPRFQKDPQFEIFKGSAFWGYRLLFNLEAKPILKKKEMRQAFRYAIDSRDLVKKTARGAGIPGSPGILSPDHIMYNPHVEQYPVDLKKARQLIASCGFSPLKDTRIRINSEGEPLAFKLLCSSGARVARSPISEVRIAEMLKESLARVGIMIQVVSLDEKSRDAAILDHNYELLIVGHGGFGQDPQFLKKRFVQSSIAGRSLSEYPSYGYTHAGLSRLLKEQQTEFDAKKRKALIWKVQKLLAEEMPEIVLFNTTQYSVFRPGKYGGWRRMFDHHSIVHSKLSFLNADGRSSVAN